MRKIYFYSKKKLLSKKAKLIRFPSDIRGRKCINLENLLIVVFFYYVEN